MLRDVREFSTTASTSQTVILRELNVQLPTAEELEASVLVRKDPHNIGHLLVSAVKDDLQGQTSLSPMANWFEQLSAQAADAEHCKRTILPTLGTALIAYLGAEARFRLTEGGAAFNRRAEAPANALQSLSVADKSVMAELRRAFKAAFGMDIGLDWGAMTWLYLRVAKDFGQVPETPDGITELMEQAEELQKQGDGFRSFTGIAMAMLAYPERLILLDEPEAFLHPTQARVLGRWVAKQATSRAGQVVVATHSADFLAGLVSAGESAKIMRLNRTESGTNFHLVPPDVTTSLVKSPLLSSQPVLDSMFHRGVVICEGDPDRAVYQTVAQRTSALLGEDYLFIHCNGKDAAHSPADLLRKSGTPVCVVTDFDVLNSEDVLERIVQGLTGAGLDVETKKRRAAVAQAIELKTEEQSLDELKTSVAQWSERVGDLRQARRSLVAAARAGSNKWAKAKKKGVAALPKDDQPKAIELLEILAGHRLFVVPCGELESWLSLGFDKGRDWNRRALEELHKDNCPHELKEFVSKILASLVPDTPKKPAA